MELWIRSQDRQELIKVSSRFHIQETSVNPHSHKWGILIDGYNYYAEYDSEKRALEVLGEIQHKINMINLGHDFASSMIDLNNPTYIYEMPKE